MFESVLMGGLHDVDVEDATEHHVAVHCFGSDGGGVSGRELEEGVALGTTSFFGAGNAQFLDATKLREELLQFRFAETFRQMSNVDNIFVDIFELQLLKTS